MHRLARTLRLLSMAVALLLVVWYVARVSDWSNFTAAPAATSSCCYYVAFAIWKPGCSRRFVIIVIISSPEPTIIGFREAAPM